jgi:hypothetical protein
VRPSPAPAANLASRYLHTVAARGCATFLVGWLGTAAVATFVRLGLVFGAPGSDYLNTIDAKPLWSICPVRRCRSKPGRHLVRRLGNGECHHGHRTPVLPTTRELSSRDFARL